MRIRWDNLSLGCTVRVLDVINPYGYTEELIQRQTEEQLERDPTLTYWGTGGFYVTIFELTNSEYTHAAMVSTMSFAVEKYLESKGLS